MGVMELQAGLLPALGRRWGRNPLSVEATLIADPLPHVAAGSRSMLPVIVVEVNVVRIVLSRRMRREVDGVVMGDLLIVRSDGGCFVRHADFGQEQKRMVLEPADAVAVASNKWTYGGFVAFVPKLTGGTWKAVTTGLLTSCFRSTCWIRAS